MKELETFEKNSLEKAPFLRIDQKAEEITAALNSSPIYKKHGLVHARPAQQGETVETILVDGTVETVNVGNEDDWVVTNPSGERYIISSMKFQNRYTPLQEEGVYEANGLCRAITNPFNTPIEIMASWGELQTGDENCMIADVCDENGNLAGEPYLIDGNAFKQTYTIQI